MTPMEMKERCSKQIQLQGENAEVGLIVPRVWRNQKRMRLINDSKAPWGKPVGHIPPHRTMCFFFGQKKF